MKAKEAMILWDAAASDSRVAGQCRVVRHAAGEDDQRFIYSYINKDPLYPPRELADGDERLLALLLLYVRLVVRDGLDPSMVTKEFSKIDEFREGFLTESPAESPLSIPLLLARWAQERDRHFGFLADEPED
jgi:hypothetical protein